MQLHSQSITGRGTDRWTCESGIEFPPNPALTPGGVSDYHLRPMPGRPTSPRPLTIVADDYGIGCETSRGILELALEGRVTAAVLLVNAPDAHRAARAWLAAEPPADFGWHANLTIDCPILPPSRVPSLVTPDGL